MPVTKAPIKNLPAMITVGKSIGYNFVNIASLVKVMFLWVLISFLFNLLFEFLGVGAYLSEVRVYEILLPELPTYSTTEISRINFQQILDDTAFEIETMKASLGELIELHVWGNWLITIVAFSSVAVAWARKILLTQKPSLIRFGGLEIKLFLYFIAFIGVFAGILFVVGFIYNDDEITNQGLGFIIIMFGFVLLSVASRFLLVFPGVAVGDRRMNPISSWFFTANNSWDMYGGIIVTSLFCIPFLIAKITFGISDFDIYLNQPFQLALSIIIMLQYLTFLCMAYKYFVPRPQDGDLA